MNISYDYYRVFYYVAKYKNFTGAARALFNNQPNISRMMKRLEKELGCTLFVRQRHGIMLTPEGEKLYVHVAVAFEHLLSGEEEIGKDRGLQSGTVTIAASEIALHCVLLPVLKDFRKIYSGIRIKILSHSAPKAIDVLNKGMADLAIVTEPYILPAGLSARSLKSVEEVPVCSKTIYPFSNPNITKEQFLKYPLIGLGEKTGSFSYYSKIFNDLGATYMPDIEAATADQILPFIKADLGIGFVPLEFLEKENMEQLQILQMETPILQRNICILKRKDNLLGIAAAKLNQQLIQTYIESDY